MKAKKRRLSPRKLLKIRRKEKDPAVRDRIMLNVHIERDGMSMSMAARHLGMAPSWGVKWRRRYLEEGIRGLQTRSRSGRPPWIPKETMKKVRKTARDTVYMTAESLLGFVRKESGAEPKYTLQYARLLLRRWGFTRKVPMGRHVRRANRQKIAWFRKKLKPLIEEKTKEGYAVAMQDEAIVIAEARARRGIYTPKGVRGVYTYTGSHSKTIVFGVITTDGRGYFERYSSFTKEEFVKFLKAVHAKFGKTLIILDGAAQHRAKCVKEELKKLVGLELKFLPPGCPDLNAIEEVWRQMKHAVLDIPYVTFGKMCSDIDKWLNSSMPKLDIENYLYRKA